MNILMMTNTYFPIMGGLEKSVESFAVQFRKMGHQVLIVAPEFKKRKKNEAGVVRVPAIQNFNGTDFSVNLPVHTRVAKLIEAFRPDVIHSHHPFLMGDMAMRLAGQYQIPLVFTYHTMFEQYTKYFPLNTEAGKSFVMELAAGYANLADHVIAPSESVRAVLIERGIETPITVVPTGVDRSFFKKGTGLRFRASLRIPREAFIAGYAGRISAEKNLKFLGRAVSDFLMRNPKAHFLVVGDGPFLTEFRGLFIANKVVKRTHFAGILRGAKLLEAYHAMDVFAFASQSETQGMVVTEAMAAGLPVVAVDAPGVREVVRDLSNGRLLPAENARLFSKALEEVMKQSPEKRKRMKEAALETAKQFSIENCAERALEVYRNVKIKRQAPSALEQSAWFGLMNRIKTEWEMLANFGKAATTALVS